MPGDTLTVYTLNDDGESFQIMRTVLGPGETMAMSLIGALPHPGMQPVGKIHRYVPPAPKRANPFKLVKGD